MSNAEVDFTLGINPRSVIPLRDVILLRGDLVCSGIRLSPGGVRRLPWRLHSPLHVIAGILGLQLSAFRAENPEVTHPPFLQGELQGCSDYAQSVSHTAPEIDGGCLLEIFGRARDLANVEAEIYALRQHLVVEYKVVRVFQQGELYQDFATEGTIAGVIFGQLDPQKHILERGEKPVRDIFIEWHASMQRLSADDA